MSEPIEITVQPTGEETSYAPIVQLDGKRYALRLYTNATDGRWYLDFDAQDGASVVRGLALAAGVDLLEPYRHLDTVPPGALFVSAPKLTSDPTGDDFTEGRAHLYYLEAES